MNLDFEKFAAKGNEFLHTLESNLGIEDRAHASRILRSTFKVLRNHLSIVESFDLLSQLPMAIKSVYVDGWTTHTRYRLQSLDDFLVEVLSAEGSSAWRDFSSPEEILDAVRAVIETLRRYVSEEELMQALHSLPKVVYEGLLSENQPEL